MLGQIRDLISVRRPVYFVDRKQKQYNTHDTSHICIILFIFVARKHVCNVTYETTSFVT